MKIGAIALNTWRETVRDRLLIAVLVLLAMVMGGAAFYEGLGAERARPLLDLSLSAMNGLGTLIAIFLGTSLVHKELDRRTIYVVLTKPVSRLDFLVGKYLGLMAALTVMVLGMAAGLGVLMTALSHVQWQLFAVLAGLWMQLGLVTAIAFCFSTVTSGILSAIYTGGLFLIGMQTEMIREFAQSEVVLNRVNYVVGHMLYYVLPNFAAFDYKNLAVYGGALPWGAWAWGLAYGATLSAAFLVMAAVAWQTRELP